MRQGVSFPTARDVARVETTATFDAAYPSTNLLDLRHPRRIGRASASGALAVYVYLSEPREIAFGALVHHNGPSGVGSAVTFHLPDTGRAWELGGLELGGWWDWTDMMFDRDLGFASGASISEVIGGVEHVTRQWSPLLSSGNMDGRTLDELEGVLLDFQIEKGLSEPYVWCRDADDSSTWARECALVRNNTLPAGVADDVLSGKVSLAMIEHL